LRFGYVEDPGVASPGPPFTRETDFRGVCEVRSARGKKLPGLEKAFKEPSSQNLRENFDHEIPKNEPQSLKYSRSTTK